MKIDEPDEATVNKIDATHVENGFVTIEKEVQTTPGSQKNRLLKVLWNDENVLHGVKEAVQKLSHKLRSQT